MEFIVFETFDRKNRPFLYLWPDQAVGKQKPVTLPGVNAILPDTSTFLYYL